ncbi:hypothetical protein MPLA_1800203 [Mesorhizobium sp. ORS 3359]|nr:hypothetical protein MPLA_1800203 [Mesorhizobium sp. ORS 3359]
MKLKRQYLMNNRQYRSICELTYLRCGVIKMTDANRRVFLNEIRAMPDLGKKGTVLETTLVGA